MSSNARRTVLFPEPESPVRMTSWRDSRMVRCFTAGGYSTLDPPLMGAGDTHIFAVFGHGAPSHLNAAIFQLFRNLIVGQRLGRILFVNHFLNESFQRQERHPAAFRSVDRFAEKGSQLQNTSRCVRILARHSAAHG